MKDGGLSPDELYPIVRIDNQFIKTDIHRFINKSDMADMAIEHVKLGAFWRPHDDDSKANEAVFQMNQNGKANARLGRNSENPAKAQGEMLAWVENRSSKIASCSRCRR